MERILEEEAKFTTPRNAKNIIGLKKPMSSVKRTSSFAFAFEDSPFVVPPSPLMKRLGIGTQVTIYRFKRQKIGNNSNASPWAIKKSKLGLTRNPINTRLTAEGEILRKLNHPNIVKFKKLTKTEQGEICLSMEAFGKGLDDLICKRQETGEMFNSKQILKVTWDIANALDYLHNSIHLLHGDMKSGNILVKGDFEEVKLCDFGVSIFLKDDLSGPRNVSDTYVGSEPWLSKEVMEENKEKIITDKADVFAYGLVIWEMLALDVPHTAWINDSEDEGSLDGSFSGNINNESATSLSDEYYNHLGTRPPLPDHDYPEDYNPVIGTFICCTCEDYTKRPNAADIVSTLSEYKQNVSQLVKNVDQICSDFQKQEGKGEDIKVDEDEKEHDIKAAEGENRQDIKKYAEVKVEQGLRNVEEEIDIVNNVDKVPTRQNTRNDEKEKVELYIENNKENIEQLENTISNTNKQTVPRKTYSLRSRKVMINNI